MNFVIEFISCNKVFIRLLLWLRGLLIENKIPYTLFLRLKNYTPELSKNIPDIKEINKCLENDINYLNIQEEFMYTKKISKVKSNKKAKHDIMQKQSMQNIRKYHIVKIVSYHDIIEVEVLIDRIFVLDISMDSDDPCSIYSLYKKNAAYIQKSFYYSVRLSSLANKFKN